MTVFGRTRLVGFGVLAVTFLVGGLAGAAVDRMLVDGPALVEDRRDDDDDRRRYIIDQVELSAEQRAMIDSILERRTDRMRAVWRDVEPHLDAITDSARSEIMNVLTAEQRAEYEAMLERRRQERQERRDREAAQEADSEPAGSR